MHVIWLVSGYLLIALVALSCVVAGRRSRLSVPSREKWIEEFRTEIIEEEWARVAERQCRASACPRMIGNPGRPPRDAECRECAGAFLDDHWRDLLGSPTQR